MGKAAFGASLGYALVKVRSRSGQISSNFKVDIFARVDIVGTCWVLVSEFSIAPPVQMFPRIDILWRRAGAAVGAVLTGRVRSAVAKGQVGGGGNCPTNCKGSSAPEEE